MLTSQMVISRRFFGRAVRCMALLTLCQLMHGQTNDSSRVQPAVSRTNRMADASDLANDNFNHVAASAIQIRTVLLKDAGLLVELKRWVAKEATDSGQVVEDSKLTDQAIFDRLDHDVGFRSVATRLLQRYGYLMPTPNPDSDFAKEQDLVLKERARRLVALEAQEDSLSLVPPKQDHQKDVERTATCDPAQDESCEKQNPRTRPPDYPVQQNEPQVPDSGPSLPLPGYSPSLPMDRTLRTDLGMSSGGGLSGGGILSGGLLDRGLTPGAELSSSSMRLTPDLAMGAQSSNLSALAALMAGGSANSSLDGSVPRESAVRDNVPTPSVRPRTSKYGRHGEGEDVTPVKMVRPANPYADIPSLYDMYVQAAAWQRPAERFGLEVFRNSQNLPDVIPMDLPVGPDYVVGPGDSLAIDLWGSVSQRLVRLVNREGRVSLPEVGPLLVSGKSLSDVQLDVQRVLRAQFRDVSADVSVSRLRTVRVYVVGDVAEPGAYDISSLSTPLNALFAAGGVTARGSLRTVKHYRGKELIEEVDAYDLLLHGVRSDLKRLQNGDSLLVPSLGSQVTVEGMVRRPAIYELLSETSLAEVLELAGGILPTAALRHIEVQRLEAHEKRTMLSLDLTSTSDPNAVDQQLEAFKIHDGDEVHIFPIAAYNEDALYLQGHVLRPGRYSYKQGMKLTDLISSYSDLLPEPAPHYAEIVRLSAPDFRPSVESFDLSSALANPTTAPALNRLDTVRIFSRYDFESPPDVWVGGEVRAPGKYRTSGQAHLRDAIYLAGGITQDASLDSAQLFRTQADGTMKVLSVNLGETLAGNPVDNLVLEPRDRVLVHRNPARIDAPTVYVEGEVTKPGRYPLTTNMRVEDLVRVAGGLKRSAYADSADLTRFAAGDVAHGSNQRIEVKLAAVLAGDPDEDVALHNGDVLTIRQIPQWNDLGASVTVRGEVQHPATYGIQPGEKMSSLLQRCGGFTGEAYPYGAVLMRKEVRDLEMKSRLELVERIKAEEVYVKSLPENDADQRIAKLTAIAKTETALQQLEETAPIGRVVIHIPADTRKLATLARTPADIQLRDGDELIIPKKANYILVRGQVFNPTAVAQIPGKNARWYLSQAGGLTQIADKSAVFVIRADGSVVSKNASVWSGDPMGVVLRAGDSIVVPEKAPKVAPRNWGTLLQAAQVATSVAIAVSYLHP